MSRMGAAAALEGEFPPGMFDQDAPHGHRCRAKEMRPILPGLLVGTHQAEPGFMDQGGRLKGVSRGFVGHFVGGQPAQFSIHNRQQFLGALGIALLDRLENPRDIMHRPDPTAGISSWKASTSTGHQRTLSLRCLPFFARVRHSEPGRQGRE